MERRDKGSSEKVKGSCAPLPCRCNSERAMHVQSDILIGADGFFPLLKLPPEIRNKVYFYTFGAHFHIQSMSIGYTPSLMIGRSMYSVCLESPEQWSWSHKSPVRVSSTSHSQIAILLSNHRISEEALSVLYSTSMFHFDDPESLAVFLLATPERHLAVITRLKITAILHPEGSAPNAWTHYISIGIMGKMKHLKFFEVCIWATYPEPYGRRSHRCERRGNSESMPCLEHGIVALVRDKLRNKRLHRNTMGPAELANTMVKLMERKWGSSGGARWTFT